jgi:release factor glutamine methyltransferase
MSGRPVEVLRRASAYLDRHGVESPEAAAEALLLHVLGTDRAGLYRRDELDREQARAFGRALCRRCAGTPVQHLTGVQAFRRIDVAVRPDVFIPRPETEVVVDHALAALADVDRPAVVDVGTGSGAIALAIADERRDARVLATDRSHAAVELAAENAERLEVAIEVLEGDLLDPLPDELRGAVDLVVANPPYVEPERFEELPADVLAEPPDALVGGIGTIRRLAAAAIDVLRPGGALVLEIGSTQGEAAAAALSEIGYTDVRIERDLTGRDRVAIGARA